MNGRLYITDKKGFELSFHYEDDPKLSDNENFIRCLQEIIGMIEAPTVKDPELF